MFESLFVSSTTVFDMTSFLICTGTALLLGVAVALFYMYKNIYTKGFILSLVLLPAMVCVVIMLVNGNLGAGVAVMGAFSLVRFRSVPGNALDISVIFLSMAIGLATGMGYVGIAALFTFVILLAGMMVRMSPFGNENPCERILKITIPEQLNYNEIFDDIFEKYTKSCELIHVKTTHMGSLYKCDYHIRLKAIGSEKDMIDEIRVRNGNLEISCGKVTAGKEEL